MANVVGTISSSTKSQIDKSLTVSGMAADAKATGDAIAEAKAEAFEHTESHAILKNNPHNVTVEQLGLEKVDNTSDMDKPVSTAQATAIADAKKAGTDAQIMATNAQTNAQAYAQTAEANAKTYADTVSQTAETNAKTYADSKHMEFTVTIPASNWYNISSSVYQNELPVNGLLGSDKVDVDVFMFDHSIESIENNMKIEEEFAKIFHIPYGDGTMWVRAREKPEVDIPIKIKVVR